MRFFVLFFFAVLPMMASGTMQVGGTDALTEYRYCGAPHRDAKGVIIRRADTLAAFQRIHPCPATMATSGACPGWAKNHVVPLACGGCDAVSNLQWLATDIKACSGPHCVDRVERSINAASPPFPDTADCKNVIVK